MQKGDTLPSKLVGVYDLKQGLANFVSKGPGSKYLRHRQPSSLGLNCSVLRLQPRGSQRYFCVTATAWLFQQTLQKQVVGQIWPIGHGLPILI